MSAAAGLGVDNFGRKVAAAEQIGEHLLRCQLSPVLIEAPPIV
jgi:hypothetical protein